MRSWVRAAMGVVLAVLLMGSLFSPSPSRALLPLKSMVLTQVIETNPGPLIKPDAGPRIVEDPRPPIVEHPTPPMADDPTPPIREHPTPPMKKESKGEADR